MTPTPLLPADLRATSAPAIPACMGGWCAVRDRCQRHLQTDRGIVAERLCPKGGEWPASALAPRARISAEEMAQ